MVFQRLVAELNKEQEAFIANKHTEKGEAVAPWVGAPNEDVLREECLSLSTSHELNAMAQAENNPTQTPSGNMEAAEVQVTTGQESSGTVTTGSNSALADSPGHEFVSDSMRVSDTDLEEVREGMKKLGMQPPKG
ncbi:hypothetical protein WH47_06129 [Habropoda laboriosa]|uniref:Uncharacterized protein n=1 Tax=Habropoda laboriosa TaxID=597456 RepID=A0A0L7QRN7_9HYME|nr:hypothetical protein WH47_06129 [Habropoda laboriosa]